MDGINVNTARLIYGPRPTGDEDDDDDDEEEADMDY